MLRIILILSLTLSLYADIEINTLYKAVPVIANSEDVSPRTRHRYTVQLIAVSGFDRIIVINKYGGDGIFNYFNSSKGYDYYTCEYRKYNLRIDRHSNVYIQYVSSKGQLGDWIKLSYTRIRIARLNTIIKALKADSKKIHKLKQKLSESSK